MTRLKANAQQHLHHQKNLMCLVCLFTYTRIVQTLLTSSWVRNLQEVARLSTELDKLCLR